MFENLTFTERRALVSKLRSGVIQCRYERGHLVKDPRAVCYEGQNALDYLNLIDDAQAVVDDVQAVDRARFGF